MSLLLKQNVILPDRLVIISGVIMDNGLRYEKPIASTITKACNAVLAMERLQARKAAVSFEHIKTGRAGKIPAAGCEL
jgi:hypothetical protein